MPFTFLEAQDLRLITRISFSPHPQLNLIFGPNASGKSSLLEAIAFLGLGRSFRTSQVEHVIRRGAPSLRVLGRYREVAGTEHVLGIERGPRTRRIKVNEEAGSNTAVLAQLVPIQIIAPETHRAFFEDSQERRRALDWGLFHVEHSFFDQWKRYHRALKQRNAALRAGQAARAWDQELAQTGEALHALRAGYVAAWTPRFEHYCRLLMGEGAPGFRYAMGWDEQQGLLDSLRREEARDRDAGYTHSGPHRADITLDFSGQRARFDASHGQQKMLVIALKLAQLDLLAAISGRGGVLLLDDLPADLDSTHRARVLEAVAALGAQAFVTATDEPLLSATTPHAVFHVEQGVLSGQ